MIPEAFLARMRGLLPQTEYEAFSAALEQPAVRALRANTRKATAENLIPLLPFSVTPLPFVANAYYAPEEKVGGLAAHHAGMFYMQDPGAISTVAAAAPREGLRVLDLCAAPGGKSTQLAAAIGEAGVLVSNEYVPARCRILQGNMERMGVCNTVITNLDTRVLADFYGAYFDLVVADAPCSGEGMFRKYEVAGEEWSEENVRASAARQREILENAVRCVAPGGRLLYSTCTFSLEENEENVLFLLDRHPDFQLIPVSPAIAAATADGIPLSGREELRLCRRFYPHRSPGEGQFVALLKRAATGVPASPKKDGLTLLTKAETDTVTALFAETLEKMPQKRLAKLRDSIYLVPDIPVPGSGVFAPGVCVGTLLKGRIEPHHQFYSAYGASFKRKLLLSASDERVNRYLRGEEIDAPELSDEKNGYACVLFEGAPLGGGKAVCGRLKNHYPKGLRNRS
ncbi:MAG: SAM-dependent methyltransferase [Ruminococcaceae bacterium]|nr:SAM-dependent methyltransferase [Oscillospiraceae bacterium]